MLPRARAIIEMLPQRALAIGYSHSWNGLPYSFVWPKALLVNPDSPGQ
jgi:hypothetical protein